MVLFGIAGRFVRSCDDCYVCVLLCESGEKFWKRNWIYDRTYLSRTNFCYVDRFWFGTISEEIFLEEENAAKKAGMEEIVFFHACLFVVKLFVKVQI